MGYSTKGGRPSKLRDQLPAGEQARKEHQELEAALFWANRIRIGDELQFHLADLCLTTLQQHLATLVRHIPAQRGAQTYRGLCPGCGRAVELERGEE